MAALSYNFEKTPKTYFLSRLTRAPLWIIHTSNTWGRLNTSLQYDVLIGPTHLCGQNLKDKTSRAA